MNRLLLGIALLIFALVAGTVCCTALERIHTQIADELAVAADTADPLIAERATQSWQRWRGFSAAFNHHEPLEQMDLLFDRLARLNAARQPEEFSRLCAQLSRLSRAIAESNRLTWWNFL